MAEIVVALKLLFLALIASLLLFLCFKFDLLTPSLENTFSPCGCEAPLSFF